MLSRRELRGNAGLDALDADSAFALVFLDDVAALYVRRSGPLRPLAQQFGYRRLPGGSSRFASLQAMCASDSLGCSELVGELERATAASPHNAQTRSLLANVAMMKGDYWRVRDQLTLALAADPNVLRAHERLGMIDLEEGRPREALAEFGAERRRNGSLPGLDLRVGQAYRRLGDRQSAERSYRRELDRNPGNQEASDSLVAITSR